MKRYEVTLSVIVEVRAIDENQAFDKAQDRWDSGEIARGVRDGQLTLGYDFLEVTP
jgi:hypothetical protein